MHMIVAFAAKAGAALLGSSGAAAGATAATAATTATAATAASATAATAATAGTTAATAAKGLSLAKILGAASFAGSTVAAVSNYAMMKQQAAASGMEAFDEQLAASTEFVQAAEKKNAIQREFLQVVADQQLAATAGGVDVGSGSVMEARRAAQAEADRQMSIAQNSAAMNASLRRARSTVLRRGATVTRRAADMTLAGDVLSAGGKAMRVAG